MNAQNSSSSDKKKMPNHWSEPWEQNLNTSDMLNCCWYHLIFEVVLCLVDLSQLNSSASVIPSPLFHRYSLPVFFFEKSTQSSTFDAIWYYQSISYVMFE